MVEEVARARAMAARSAGLRTMAPLAAERGPPAMVGGRQRMNVNVQVKVNVLVKVQAQELSIAERI